ncbi:MAG: hypothetical protein U0805_20430 [Pirellulales bacterium]
MQLGKAVLGAVVGGAIGIGLLLVLYLTAGLDQVWLAIPFAIITGLGVRMLVSTSGHASYARGAVTMILALAAYIGGWMLVAQVATARANAPKKMPVPATTAADKEGEGTGNAEAAPATPPPPVAQAPMAHVDMKARGGPRQFSTWDFIWLAIAALVAYELGRGSELPGAGGAVATDASTEPLPAVAHTEA